MIEAPERHPGVAHGLVRWLPLLAIAAMALVIRLPTLGQPLVEAHAFRQTQTAYTALEYHRAGIDLLQTPLPTLGPPWVIPFEFPLFQAFAALVMDMGLQPDLALRVTSLAFFAISAAILYAIVRLEAPAARNPAVIAFLFAPLGLLWSRSSTIETLAVALALGSVLGALHWDRSGSRAGLAAAIGLGCLAAMVKITTAAVWLAPAAFLLRRSRIGALAIPGVAALAGLLWTSYADAIKAATPATEALVSPALRDWTFGTLAQRFDPGTWIIDGGWLLGLFGAVLILSPRALIDSRLARWSVATIALGVIVFPNFYAVHDYYWMAAAPAVAILVGLVVARILSMPDRGARRVRLLGAVVLIFVSFVAYPRWTRMFMTIDEADTLRLAAQIQAATNPTDLVGIEGRDWSPDVLYYADRRGFTSWPGAPEVPPGYVLFRCPAEGATGDCIPEP